MGWFKLNDAERSDGETEKIEDVRVNVKTDNDGNVTDVLVGRPNEPEHDHFWNVDKPTSGAEQRVDWSQNSDETNKPKSS